MIGIIAEHLYSQIAIIDDQIDELTKMKDYMLAKIEESFATEFHGQNEYDYQALLDNIDGRFNE
eukprot:6562717-Prorocentrum_lima.AAC.1